MQGQQYDGVINMRGVLNGLQTLFIKDFLYANYVHCFAHQLQLALVVASKYIWEFFSKLSFMVNLVGVSAKGHMGLRLQIC